MTYVIQRVETVEHGVRTKLSEFVVRGARGSGEL